MQNKTIKIHPINNLRNAITPSHKMEEECGVFAMYDTKQIDNVAYAAYCGLFALQHRGQESAGITIANFGHLETIKGMGLVNEVFNVDELAQNGIY